MKIAVDVDGVLADVMPVWVRVYNEKYAANLTPQDVVAWSFWQLVGITEREFFRIFSETWRNWRAIELTEEGLPAKLEALRHFGQVDILTGRSPDTIEYVKRWLQARNLRYDRFVAVTPRTNKAMYRYDVFIDDSPTVAEAVAKTRSTLLLLDRPWNRSVSRRDNVLRVKDFGQAVEHVKQLATRRLIDPDTPY